MSKKNNMAKTMEQTVNANEVSRISFGTIIKGEIHSPNDIRIDGCFEGKLESKGRVVVGEKAEIKGDVFCDNLDFWGKLSGNVYVKDTLSLKSSCEVNGNLNVKRLSVELGAKFNGNCKMIKEGELDSITQTEAK